MNNLRKLQLVDLAILKEVDALCKVHNLTWYMIGGTLLGAVRHKGFIPWDDDIDIAMPRKDYEKFLEIAKGSLSQHLQIINFETNPDYRYYITRVMNLKTKVAEKRAATFEGTTHASIDIFPIDGTPNNKLLKKIYYFRIMAYRALISLCYKEAIDQNRKRNLFEKILIYIGVMLPLNRILSPYKLKKKIDRMLKKQSVEKSDEIGTIMGAYRTREIVPKIYFGKGQFYEFEGLRFNGPEKYDEYLTHMYGDYMSYPENVDRKDHYKIIEI